MADHNFARFFIVLNGSGRQNGYCKVERLNDDAVFSISARNIEEKSEMLFAVLVKNRSEPVLAGNVPEAEEGTLYKSFRTDAEDIFGSGDSIREIEAVYVLKKTLVPVLSGWRDRNIQKSEAESYARRLSLLSLPDEKEDKDNDNVYSEDVEDTEEEDEKATDSENKSNDPPNKLASFTPYIETIQKLYEGLTTSKSKKPDTGNSVQAATGYRQFVGKYFEEKKEHLDDADFFDYSGNNTIWKIADREKRTVLGLTYAEGKLRYIINCEPSACGMMYKGIPVMAVWLPTTSKTENAAGYWCTFIDAETGNIIMPDFTIL